MGGGPAGLAAAIAARLNGLQATVADSLQPPIDKACGEGLMPDAVAALRKLGVRFSPGEAFPFRGIRFLDGRSGLSTEALFPQGAGLAVRRTTLHSRLAERASGLGAAIHWGGRVTLPGAGRLLCDGREVRSRWIVGADGLQSRLRTWAGLQPGRRERTRYGFRQHFRAAPWTDLVEVYWGDGCQIAVTPTAPDEVGLAMVSRNSQMRIAASACPNARPRKALGRRTAGHAANAGHNACCAGCPRSAVGESRSSATPPARWTRSPAKVWGLPFGRRWRSPKHCAAEIFDPTNARIAASDSCLIACPG